MPIRIITANFQELEKVEITKTQEELKKELTSLANKTLEQENIRKVIAVKDEFVIKNNTITIKRKAKCLENIAIEKPINISDVS